MKTFVEAELLFWARFVDCLEAAWNFSLTTTGERRLKSVLSSLCVIVAADIKSLENSSVRTLHQKVDLEVSQRFDNKI